MPPAKKPRAKAATPAVPVPQSAADAEDTIRIIGECQRQLELLTLAQSERASAMRERFAAEARPFADEMALRIEGLRMWCEANRAALTNDGKTKTVQFAAGEVCWRKRPPSVRIAGVAAVLERLKALGLSRFIRVTEEINKEAILAEADVAGSIEGVKVASGGEDFEVKPLRDAARPAREPGKAA